MSFLVFPYLCSLRQSSPYSSSPNHSLIIPLLPQHMPHPSQPAASHYITNLFNAHTLPSAQHLSSSLSVTLHTFHLTILISALSSFDSCSAFTAHVSFPYIIELQTHAPYTFPFNLNATFLLVKIPDNSLNFFQPHLTLEIDASLDPPSPFNISPR